MQRGAVLLLILLILLFGLLAAAARKPPHIDRPDAFARPEAGTEEETEELPVSELPAIEPDDLIITRSGYALSYSEIHEQAEWVAYELTREEAAGGVERSDDFREDPLVSTGSATLADYRRSGFDRGHLAPAADMAWSEEAMRQSFFLSNMSPQTPAFNRGIWRELEELVREWAIREGSILVVTGPVLTDGPFETIGPEGVSIPKRFYKVILDHRAPERKAIGFLLANEGSSEPLAVFAVPIDRVEAVTGLDFFPELPDRMEARLEAALDLELWGLSPPE